MNILTGMAITPVDGMSVLINTTVRVLRVNVYQDQLSVIEAAPRHRAGRLYFTAPFHLKISQINKEISANTVRLLSKGVTSRSDVIASDDALNKKYNSTPCKCVQLRNARFSVISTLIPGPEDYSLLLDSQCRNELINKYLDTNQDDNKSINRQSVQQLIFQFLAEGSTRNSLTPYLALRGGRGKERVQSKKIGRHNALTAAGIPDSHGFVMTTKDKEICEYAFRHYLLRGNTIGFALRKMWTSFYSEQEQNDNGTMTMRLFPQNKRPTRAQFVRWGGRYSNQQVWQKQYNTQQLARLDRALIGKANNGIVAVGQVGAIDSTTTDTEFVSVTNRLKRIGQAHRVLLVDSLYGYIAGFYMGIEAASATTVNLAILHAASDKTEWLGSLGLDNEIDSKDWLSIQFGRLLADNTDARNMKNMEEQNALGVGIAYVPTHRSDLNAVVETAHKSLHRIVDHKLPGTTRGKRLERGDTRPDALARMTIIEGVRETARAIHFHNTCALDVSLTLEMRRELVEQGLTVNRLNLTRMAIQQGKVHASITDFNELICTLGTPVQGTFTAEGVKLHRTDTSQRTFFEPIRYISKDSEMLMRFREAKTNRRGSPLNFDAEFFCNPYFPKKIFYRNIHSGKVYPLVMESNEVESDEYTLADYLSMMDDDAVYQFITKDQKQQQLSELEQKFEQSTNRAEAEYNLALKSSPPIPKSRISRDKKENRKQEKAHLAKYNPILDESKPSAVSQHVHAPENHLDRETGQRHSNILDRLIAGT